MSIKPLPVDVVAQIKSSVVITSLNNVICGLIKNSLDAEATKINLSVDYSRGNCSVEDNGAGVPPSEFRDDGGLGQLHCTWESRACAHTHNNTLASNNPIKTHQNIRHVQTSMADMVYFWRRSRPCHCSPWHPITESTTRTIR